MQTTHTPGPWAIAPSSNPKNGSAWRDIVSMGSEFSPAYVGEALEHDARLIAAAPAMLDALLDALPYVEDVLSDPAQLAAFKPGTVQRHAKAIRAAIAAATGEA